VVIMDRRAGSLLSANVGLPQDVAWRGRIVHTAVWKRPVDGPQMVRRLNIDGDGQGDLAAHGGEHRAVFMYQIDSYRYWQEQLGRNDFTCGQFGENLTVTSLADDQVCIGDRYRIGSAVVEVTQPRVTCHRVGIRMDDPRIPALLISHHRPGFYLRVLTEGRVQAGDDIVKIASGPEGMTVAEIDALLYLSGHSRQQLRRALRIPALPAGWRTSFQEMLSQARRDRQRGPDGGEPAAVLAGVPPAHRDPDRTRERVSGLGLPGRSQGSSRAARPAGTVPHPAPARGRCSAATAAQLLPVRDARCRYLPDQRQA
jgi:MOSC domain-containing protein YiiM